MIHLGKVITPDLVVFFSHYYLVCFNAIISGSVVNYVMELIFNVFFGSAVVSVSVILVFIH